MNILLTVLDVLLFHDQPLMMVATDMSGRRYVGLSYGDCGEDGRGPIAFGEVDRATLAELESGTLDARRMMTERYSGLILLAKGIGLAGDTLVGRSVPRLPPQALPLPGLFVPAAHEHAPAQFSSWLLAPAAVA